MAAFESAANSLMLTFEQSTIYASDYSTLSDGKWLNDSIIGFAYDIFGNKMFGNAPKNSLLFVHPTTVNVIRFENDEEDLIPLIKDSGITNCDYVLLPINNSQSMISVSGSHWALLIYERPKNTFYYLDSAGSYNIKYARAMANKIHPLMESAVNDKKDESKANDDAQEMNFVPLKVPQQQNGYDCGMFVIEYSGFIAKYYVDRLISKDKQKNNEQSPSVADLQFSNKQNPFKFDSQSMSTKRNDWRKRIDDMSKKAQAK